MFCIPSSSARTASRRVASRLTREIRAGGGIEAPAEFQHSQRCPVPGENFRFGVACPVHSCQGMAMEITVTKPIEQFIQEQLARGYADVNEVARQAFLRWMEEDDFEADPPNLRDKLAEARRGRFHPHDPARFDALVSPAHEAAG